MAGPPPRVSVVLPFRDAKRYLDEAIRSIVSQRFADFELLLLDDGSIDGSPGIADAWADRDPRLRVIRTGCVGLTATLNRGLDEARGRYAARMDADDVAMPRRLHRQVALMDANPDVLACGSAVRLIDAAGLPLFDRFASTRHEAIVDELMRGVGGIAHPTAVIRMDTPAGPPRYDERYDVAQDRELWLRLAEVGRLANAPDVLLAYRQHDEAVAATRRDRQNQLTRQAIAEACERRGVRFDPSSLTPREAPGERKLVDWARRAALSGRLRGAAALARRAAERRAPLPLDARLLARLPHGSGLVHAIERVAAPVLTRLNATLRRS